MKNTYFTPGPSQLYPTVKTHIKKAFEDNIPSISHRSIEFMDIVETTKKNLRKLLDIPATHRIYFLSSATECMERIIESCVEKSSCHFVNGAFSGLFHKTAVNLGKQVYLNEVKAGQGFDFERVKFPKKLELACFTHNETSTGVSLDLTQIKKQIKKDRSTLFALDIVSSAPYVKVDYSFFDLVFFSVQKGFGIPAGLGVLIVSPEAFKKAVNLYNAAKSVKSYHDFINLEKYSLLEQTPETPDVLNIYLLMKVLADMNNKGIPIIRKETKYKANKIYEYIMDTKYLIPAVINIKDRSTTVCVANTKFDSGILLEKLCKSGFVVGSGYKEMKGKQIRIANFPAHSIDDVNKLISTMKKMVNSI